MVRPSRRFVGVDNYAALLDDPIFWQALANNTDLRAAARIPTVDRRSRWLMALWVNEKLPARALVRMAYFTPTVLPMIAVANLWLFFYTPQIGMLDQVDACAVRRAEPRTGSASRDTALGAMVAVAVWKEAGFFMIFYLAALQSLPPKL